MYSKKLFFMSVCVAEISEHFLLHCQFFNHLGSNWQPFAHHLVRHKVVSIKESPAKAPWGLHTACAFTIYSSDVICKLEWPLRTSVRNNSANAHDMVSPGELQSCCFWNQSKGRLYMEWFLCVSIVFIVRCTMVDKRTKLIG